jgi:hypothetical protein
MLQQSNRLKLSWCLISSFPTQDNFKYLNWLAHLQGFSIEVIKTSRRHLVQRISLTRFSIYLPLSAAYSKSFPPSLFAKNRWPGLDFHRCPNCGEPLVLCVTLQPRIFSCYPGKRLVITDHIQTKSSFPSHGSCRLPRIFSICGLFAHRVSVPQTRSSHDVRCVASGGCIFQATTAPGDLQLFLHWSMASSAWGYSQINNWQRNHWRIIECLKALEHVRNGVMLIKMTRQRLNCMSVKQGAHNI